MKRLLEQICKFGVVGVIAFLIDYGFLYIFTEFFGIHYLVSGAMSFCISVIFNYIASIIWVFDTKKDSNKVKEFVVFIVLSVIGLGINQVVMWGMVDHLNIYYMFSKIVATAVVMVYNFITRKMFLEQH